MEIFEAKITDLNKRVDRNREEINNLLSNPNLEFVYMRIRMLAAQNEKLMLEIKNLSINAN